MIAKRHLSNGLLVLGILVLGAVGLVGLTGGQIDPMLPAFSALFIGGTAVLDRVGVADVE